MKHWVSIWLHVGPQGAGHRGCLKLGSGFLPTPPAPQLAIGVHQSCTVVGHTQTDGGAS